MSLRTVNQIVYPNGHSFISKYHSYVKCNESAIKLVRITSIVAGENKFTIKALLRDAHYFYMADSAT